MSILRTCENCSNLNCEFNCKTFDDAFERDYFIPKEELVREDERNLIIKKLEKIRKIVDDNGKSYIISANLLMIIEMIKEREYDSR